MRRLLSLSALAFLLVSGVVGCDSFAARKPDTEATSRSTNISTRATNATPATFN